jgi:sterol desaturase/sphingolipid hydroxylase (fatty acid hydroxylase superfamily)
MPTPIEILLDPVSLIILAMYGLLMAWEAIAPGRKLPAVKYSKLRGLVAFVFYFYLASYLPLLWDTYLVSLQLFDLTGLGTLAGGLVGILLYEFGVYVWHRAMHKNDKLWKVFHQMHHSSERIDTYSAFYFSPLDMIGWTMLGSICLVLIIGITPSAATVTILIANFLGMFQHTNIKTPSWLGYVVQRPESHTIHHAKGIHAYNYSDLPLFDIIFGTFKNPKNYENETGFYIGASKRVLDMLLFRNVDRPVRK